MAVLQGIWRFPQGKNVVLSVVVCAFSVVVSWWLCARISGFENFPPFLNIFGWGRRHTSGAKAQFLGSAVRPKAEALGLPRSKGRSNGQRQRREESARSNGQRQRTEATAEAKTRSNGHSYGYAKSRMECERGSGIRCFRRDSRDGPGWSTIEEETFYEEQENHAGRDDGTGDS